MSIQTLFRSDPTRPLEEVQKVNAREQAATDVAEFHETDSARRVLTELGDVVETHPGEDARFLYLEATFGSGKTHLLKLIGLVADRDPEFAQLGDDLAEQWPGFDTLAQSIDNAHVDRLTPVFLNLLGRDASKEPPLPFLIFEAIGRELGYPTDPNWLLEWAWTVDMEYDGVWEALRTTTHDGQSFDDVLDERASLRRWLYGALPALSETTGTDLNDRDGVKASIENAEARVDPESFEADELVSRIETATAVLNEEGSSTELLLGLDEVALFVGDSPKRYREFERTMEALQNGPNPVVVTTGQYSLPATRESLIGEDSDDHWTHQQVLLEGADTEIIVRKRWLQKTPEGKTSIDSLVSTMPDLSLETYSSVGSSDPDPIEAYPFREYDLPLLRTVMQELITQGRPTDRDYIRGRALLVLVRSLFTKFGWASAEAGALVTWDELFDLLVEDTDYVPLWVQEMLSNTLIPTFGGDEAAWEVRVSKALYLLNQTPAVPATPENLGRLMFDDVSDSIEETVADTQSALDTLVDKRKVLTETTEQGDDVYTLVSEEQESILSRAQTRAEEISPHQLKAWLENRLRENDDFFRSEGTRHEVDVGEERLVPLRYAYSILDPIDRAPTTEYDAIQVRVLASDSETISEQVETWQTVNEGREGGEHVLVAIDVPDPTLEKIRNVLGMADVLGKETESHEELEREHRRDKRRLETSISDLLDNATVHTVDEERGDRPSVLDEVVTDQVEAVFGSTRKVLARPLTEVEDAKALASFFRGSRDWPLTDGDAVLLGVDRSSAEIVDGGWCRAFIDKYESQAAVDVETVLQQTQTANGAYRGTPQESIAALLITLATSNEQVALKKDTEYVTDPAAIGRLVRTKGGLTSLQVRFGVDTVDPTEVRTVVSMLLGHDPDGSDLDAWVAELADWVDANSALIKRTVKDVSKEFDVSLDALEAALEPAYSGGDLTTSSLVEEDIQSQAETFATARELFDESASDGATALWTQFTETLDTLEERYPDATITERMRATASGGTVPTAETVTTRLADASGYRVDELSTQYRRVTGEQCDATDPEAICEALTEWVRDHESAVRELLTDTTDTFDGVSFDALESVFETAWDGGELEESDFVVSSVDQQLASYENAREILRGTPSPWSKLEARYETLREEHPESPTTRSVEAGLARSQPPSRKTVQRLIDMPIIGGDDVWAQLQARAEELRTELPNADLTDTVTGMVDADDRPTDERARALLDEAEALLERIRTVKDTLDDADDGSVVIIEDDA
ncbi:hypothetical protein [Halomarina oriensis]|uniref:BREX system P-loop protein BrxC n=1 Tax=Halomarina oriensis TaxID=671145 RepID=A0A6B0GK45_9EURY|nr:hypothetical protein [Halomarina oriensis]MWG35296.1 hypothetical protein [Halomarina oriensis]